MSRVYICQGRYAEVPYRLDKGRQSVWCIEELCHYLKENAFLLDKELFCDKLADWLEKECLLEVPAVRLRKMLKHEESIEEMASALLSFSGYYSRREVAQIRQKIEAGTRVTLPERRKARADQLLKKRNYVAAMQEYRELLGTDTLLPPAFRGKVLHNIGVAQAGLFQYERADHSFGEAYREGQDPESLIGQLAAKRMLLNEQEYLAYIAEHPDTREASLILEGRLKDRSEAWTDERNRSEIASIRSAFFLGDQETCDRLMGEELERLKGEYRAQVAR